MPDAQSPAPDANRVAVKDPDSGKVLFIDPADLAQAAGAGFKPLGRDEALAGLKDEYMQSGVGQLATGAAGFLRGLSGGLSDLALDRTGAMKGSDLRSISELNPASSTLGHVAGLGAAMLVPGAGEKVAAGEAAGLGGLESLGAGAAADAGFGGSGSLLSSLAGGAPGAITGLGKLAEDVVGDGALGTLAKGAVEGAGFQAADNLTEDVFHDKQLTAESLLAHTGTAALLGAGGGLAFDKALGLAKTYAPAVFDRASSALEQLSKKTAPDAKPDVAGSIRGLAETLERSDKAMGEVESKLVSEDKGAASAAILGKSNQAAPAVDKTLDAIQSRYVKPAYDASPDLAKLHAHVQANQDALTSFERKFYSTYKPAEVRRLIGDEEAGGILPKVADDAVSKIEAGDHHTAASNKITDVLNRAGVDQAQSKADEFLALDNAKRELDAVKPPPGSVMTATERLYYDSIAKARGVVADSLRNEIYFGAAAKLQKEINPLDAARRASLKGYRKALLRNAENSDESGLVAATDKISRFADGQDSGKFKAGDAIKNVQTFSRDASAFVRRAAEVAPPEDRAAALELANRIESTPKVAEDAAAAVRKQKTLAKSPLEFGGTESRDAGRVLVGLREGVDAATTDAERFQVIEKAWQSLASADKLRPGLAELRDKLGAMLADNRIFGAAADHHAEIETARAAYRSARDDLRDALFAKSNPDRADPGRVTTLVNRLGRGDPRADLVKEALDRHSQAAKGLLEVADRGTYQRIGRKNVDLGGVIKNLDQVNEATGHAASEMAASLTREGDGGIHGSPIAGWVHIPGIPGVILKGASMLRGAKNEAISRAAGLAADVTKTIAAGVRTMIDGAATSSGGDLIAAETPNISHWLDFNNLAAHNADPSMMMNSMASASPNLQTHAPTVAIGAQQVAATAAQYLQAHAPKNPVPPSGLPGDPEYTPSHSELETYKQKAAVIERPLSILDLGRKGELLPSHVDAVATVFPRLYQQIIDQQQEALAERREPIPYKQQLMLATLLRHPVGFTQQVLSPMFQKSPAAPPPRPDQAPQPKRTSKVVKHKLGFANASQTSLASADHLGSK